MTSTNIVTALVLPKFIEFLIQPNGQCHQNLLSHILLSSRMLGIFQRKRNRKNKSIIAATVPQNFQLFKTLEAKTNMSKTWYIGNQQFTPRPNDSASEIPENIVYKNDSCGAITSIVHFLSVKFAEYLFFPVRSIFNTSKVLKQTYHI